MIRGKPGNIEEVLKYLNMDEHLPVFILNGYENLSLQKDLDTEELDYLGISDKEQRYKLLTLAGLMFPREVNKDKQKSSDGNSNSDENSCKNAVNKEKIKPTT